MFSVGEALLLGSLPERVGVYFATMEILVEAHERSQGDTAAFLHRQLTRRHSKMAEAVAEVEQTEALLRRLGIEPPPRPQLPTDCVAWQQRVYLLAQGTLSTSDPVLATYHLLGQLCGQAWLTLQLGGLVLSLRREMPKDVLLTEQAEALAKDQQRMFGVLLRIAEHPLWTAHQSEAIANLRAAFGRVPLVAAEDRESDEEDAVSARLKGLLEEMTTFADRLSELESVLG
jgi:hypothetical protein